jgi:3-hydroxyacyl-CoA dehydrogenase
MPVVMLERQDEIAIVWIDNPPVNALSQAVRAGIIDKVNEALADDEVKAILLACKGRTFIAGADITEFGKPPLSPGLHEVLGILENSPKPIIAAIHGTAFGGGLETAMACHYRIAHASARVGQPEVKLGLIPGAGGTQRLPRLAGAKVALDMIVSGNPVGAQAAADAGIIDGVAGDDLAADALRFAREVVDGDMPLPKARDGQVDMSGLPETFFADYRAGIARKTRGYFAPEKNVQAVEAAVDLPFDEGMKRERELFTECMENPQSKALQHVFFAERQAGKVPGIPRDMETRPLNSIGMIGAGTMGGGISMNFLNAGIPVTILEMNDEALDRGFAMIRKNYEISAKKGRITDADVETRMGLLSRTTSYADLSDADLIIEAVFENMDVKKEVFRKLGEVAKPGAILATNTSYLNVDEIAAETGRPEDVLGLHFFSPANVMRLLEIVRAEKTAPDVLLTCVKMAKAIKKVGVVAGVCHGFIGNRMLEGYGREAGLLVLEGATPSQVDQAMFDFGMPMGPLAMGDMAGLDIGYMLRSAFPADRFHPYAYNVGNRLVEMDRKGQKTGAGWYKYVEGSRKPTPDPLVDAIILEEAEKAGIERRSDITAEEIVQRCLYPLINEGALILEEGIALRPGDIDVVYIYGYGFPPYRGGPMHYADHVGLGKIHDALLKFSERGGTRWWKPAPLLERLANEGKGFRSLAE